MAKRAHRRQNPRRIPVLGWIAGAAAVTAVIGVAALIASAPAPEPPFAGQDHWHAKYSVEVCGQVLPPFPGSPGDVHTHDKEGTREGDGIIHIHPASSATAGKNANLGVFLDSVGMTVTADTLQLPGQKTWRNGDRCADGRAGTVRVLVNGREVADFRPYAIQNNDDIKVLFGPQG